MAIALNCIAKKITNIVLVLALKLEMELIRGLYDRERTLLNSYNDEDVEDMSPWIFLKAATVVTSSDFRLLMG